MSPIIMEKMRPTFLFASTLILIAGGMSSALAAAEDSRPLKRVAVPVADLRREPVQPGPSRDHDPLEESQLLYGDPVRVLEEKEGWTRGEAVEQPEWTHHQRWEGYPGWIKSAQLVQDHKDWIPNLVVRAKLATVREKPALDSPVKLTLSLGTRLVGVNQGNGWEVRLFDGSTGWIAREEAVDFTLWDASDIDPSRKEIVRMTRLFLGDRYYWGGRSADNSSAKTPPHTGVDCSGLVGLAYQANHLTTPRDAHEIWMKARPIPRESLQPADLIFLSDPKDLGRITHVMLYAGDGRIIEGPGTGGKVREMNLKERFKGVKRRKVYFGTYFP